MIANIYKEYRMLQKNANLFINLSIFCIVLMIIFALVSVYFTTGTLRIIGLIFSIIFTAAGSVFAGLGKVGLIKAGVVKKRPRL